jgi:hypothetical protein
VTGETIKGYQVAHEAVRILRQTLADFELVVTFDPPGPIDEFTRSGGAGDLTVGGEGEVGRPAPSARSGVRRPAPDQHWPNYAGTYDNLGYALRVSGRNDEAAAAWKQAARLARHDLTAKENWRGLVPSSPESFVVRRLRIRHAELIGSSSLKAACEIATVPLVRVAQAQHDKLLIINMLQQ